ncbi:MAG: urease accessory UreF family protein [Rhizobacter sp.]
MRERDPRPLPAPALLRLMWLASPALPVGGFSYSEGLEAAVEAGLVTDDPSASAWLIDQLHLALVRSDLAVAAKAFGAWRRGDLDTVAQLNDWVARTRETHEMRLQTEQMGRSLAVWLTHEAADDRAAALTALAPAPTWPVAFALAAERTGAPVREAMVSFTFGWAENMVQAALKAVPLGQVAGQRVLSALVDAIPAAVDAAIALPAGERQAFTPMLAILSARHEVQYSRLFRS